MDGVLVRLGLFDGVFAAAVAAQQFDPFERQHMGMNIDDRPPSHDLAICRAMSRAPSWIERGTLRAAYLRMLFIQGARA